MTVPIYVVFGLMQINWPQERSHDDIVARQYTDQTYRGDTVLGTTMGQRLRVTHRVLPS